MIDGNLRSSAFALGMLFLISTSALAADGSGKAYLKAQELFDLYESMYSGIHNIHVSYSAMLETAKGDSPQLQQYTKYDTTETIELKGADKYYVRRTGDPNGFTDSALVVQSAFNGSATSQYNPATTSGSINPGRIGLPGEQMSRFWSCMLLNRPVPDEQPDTPLIRFYFSAKSTVRPQLEQVSGQWCHVVDAPYSRKPWATVWMAVDKGGLPMKYEKHEGVNDYSRSVLVTQVGFVETDAGKFWFPKQAVKEYTDSNGYRQYKFNVEFLKANIETTPDMFKVSFPPGSAVLDRVAGISYTTGAFDGDKPLNFVTIDDLMKKNARRISSGKEQVEQAPQLAAAGESESKTPDRPAAEDSESRSESQPLGQLGRRRLTKVVFGVLAALAVCVLAFIGYRKLASA